jgi:hypothetical protein
MSSHLQSDIRAQNPGPACSGNISRDPEPGTATLRSARWIDLNRDTGSDGARALVGEVIAALLPHLKRSRKLCAVGTETQRGHVAAILAGLLRAGFKDRPVAAQRRTNGGMWKWSLIGNRAFWGLVDAMGDAGLVCCRNGTRGNPIEWEAGEFSYSRAFGGQPTKLWPSARLLELASCRGVTTETVRDDWPISRKAETTRIDVPADRLVVCKAIDRDAPVVLAPEQAGEAEMMRKDVAALNESVAGADIRHCRAPAFSRVFRHDLRLGGRYYAIGGGDTFSANVRGGTRAHHDRRGAGGRNRHSRC